MAKEKERDVELERYMAKKWGTPEGLMGLAVAFGILLISIGVFIWLLHIAGIF